MIIEARPFSSRTTPDGIEQAPPVTNLRNDPMADPSQEGTFGFQDEPPKPAESRPAPPPPRRRPPRLSRPGEAAARAAAREAPKKSMKRREIVTVSVLIAIFLTVAIVMAVWQTMEQNEERSAL